jgi:hypothetical protein
MIDLWHGGYGVSLRERRSLLTVGRLVVLNNFFLLNEETTTTTEKVSCETEY